MRYDGRSSSFLPLEAITGCLRAGNEIGIVLVLDGAPSDSRHHRFLGGRSLMIAWTPSWSCGGWSMSMHLCPAISGASRLQRFCVSLYQSAVWQSVPRPLTLITIEYNDNGTSSLTNRLIQAELRTSPHPSTGHHFTLGWSHRFSWWTWTSTFTPTSRIRLLAAHYFDNSLSSLSIGWLKMLITMMLVFRPVRMRLFCQSREETKGRWYHDSSAEMNVFQTTPVSRWTCHQPFQSMIKLLLYWKSIVIMVGRIARQSYKALLNSHISWIGDLHRHDANSFADLAARRNPTVLDVGAGQVRVPDNSKTTVIRRPFPH